MSAIDTSPAVIGRLPRVSGPVLVRDSTWSALDASEPLTILRATRGFGKTSVLVTWMRGYRGDIPTLYLSLDQRAHDEDGFWEALGRGLLDANVPLSAPTDPPRTRVMEALIERSEPLRLVLDDYQEAGFRDGADRIDDDLAEIVRSNDQFYLVVAGWSLRTLESLGSLSVDARLLGPDDLRLSPGDVQRLAEARGADLTSAQADRIHAEFGGWPAAIRAGLRNVTADGRLDTSLVEGYIAAVVRDFRFDVGRRFLLRSAVPERFDIRLLRIITPEPDHGEPRVESAELLGWLRATGLLLESRTESGSEYSYPAAIRSALLRLVRETDPNLEGDVHRALIMSPDSHHVPGRSLLHAVHAGEWATALAMMERHWSRLLTDSPDVLVEAVQRVPLELSAADPHIRVASEHLGEIVRRMRTFSPWSIQDSLTTSDLLAAAEGASTPASQDSIVLLQWGVAAVMSGNHDAATYAFSRARNLGLTHGGVAAQMGAAGLAFVHALAGEPDLASQWLQDRELQDQLENSGDGDFGDLTVVTVSIARALVAVDSGSPGASRLVMDMVEPRHRADLWTVAEFVRSHHTAFTDDPEEIFRRANSVRAALRHVGKGTLAESVLQSTLVELLLVARMIGVAGEIASQLPEDPIGWTAHAKVCLAKHDYRGAVGYAKRSIGAPHGTRRSQLEATVVMASALHALDEDEGALHAFQSAVRLARATGLRRPFHLMHRYVFDMLAEHTPQAVGLWPSSGDIEGDAGEAMVELPTLTMREAQILRALERHTGPVGIGRSLNLSANTVKTHLRSIYRKLGVASRNEALGMASRGRLGETSES